MLHATFLSISSICWSGKLLHEFAPFATHCGMTSQEWNSTKAENEEFWKAPRFALCSLATVNHETTQSTLKVLKEGETWTWQCAIWAMKTVKNYDLKRRCRCGILRFFWGYSAETSRTLRGAWSLTLVTIARNSCFLFGDIETSDFWVRCRNTDVGNLGFGRIWMCLGCLPRAFDKKSTSFVCFVADESTLRQYRSKLSRGSSKSRQVSYLSLPRLQETSIAMRFRCTFASCVAWRCLTLTKRDFIVLAVLVSPCVGFAVTGNTAGAKQVLRGHLGGGSKALSHRKASGPRIRISKKFHVAMLISWFLI